MLGHRCLISQQCWWPCSHSLSQDHPSAQLSLGFRAMAVARGAQVPLSRSGSVTSLLRLPLWGIAEPRRSSTCSSGHLDKRICGNINGGVKCLGLPFRGSKRHPSTSQGTQLADTRPPLHLCCLKKIFSEAALMQLRLC